MLIEVRYVEAIFDLIHGIVVGGVEALVVLACVVGKGVLNEEVRGPKSYRK